jgi:hypothetical protein
MMARMWSAETRWIGSHCATDAAGREGAALQKAG